MAFMVYRLYIYYSYYLLIYTVPSQTISHGVSNILIVVIFSLMCFMTFYF